MSNRDHTTSTEARAAQAEILELRPPEETALADTRPGVGERVFKEKSYFKLTSAEHEIKVLKAPEPLRAALLWLGGFLVNRCNGNYSVAAKTLKELNFKTHQGFPSDNYVYQVVTCIYFETNPELGERALDGVVRMVEALRKYDALVSATGKPAFVPTSYWHLINDKVTALRATDNVVKWLPFVGPTDVGFSRCAEEYCTRNNHGLCIHVECPVIRTVGDLMVEIGRKYNIPSHWPRRRLEEELRENVNDKKTIFLDNFQNLYDRRRKFDQPALNYLRKLTDDTGCRFVLKWTKWDDFHTDITSARDAQTKEYLRQFLRRFCGAARVVHLELPVPESDVALIAKSFNLAKVPMHLPRLVKIANQPWGNFTPLFDFLQAARRRATARGSKTIEPEFLRWPEGL